MSPSSGKKTLPGFESLTSRPAASIVMCVVGHRTEYCHRADRDPEDRARRARLVQGHAQRGRGRAGDRRRASRRAGWPVDLCPVADGGEGTLDALAPALGASAVCGRRSRSARAADTSAVRVRAGERRPRSSPSIAIVETAAASGLSLVEPSERDPMAASTAGTGELIVAAVDAGARLVLRRRRRQRDHRRRRRARSMRSARPAVCAARRLRVLCDVRTPFEDAARVFAPQKGAAADQVRRLTQRARGGSPGGSSGIRGGCRSPAPQVASPAACGPSSAPSSSPARPRCSTSSGSIHGCGRRGRSSRARGGSTARASPARPSPRSATRARQAGVPCYAIVGESELDAFGVRILDLQGVECAGTVAKLRGAGRRLGEQLAPPGSNRSQVS